MKVGVVGLGKVGLPLALVLQQHGGHDVVGYDVDYDRVARRLADPQDHGEPWLGDLICRQSLQGDPDLGLRLATSSEQVVEHAEVVFVVVQTPHAAGYGGEIPMPPTPADFDYAHLRAACDAVANAALTLRKPVTVAVVSTVLPGTIHRQLLPLTLDPLNGTDPLPLVRYAYNPAFISLGSVVADLLRPDFILVGADDEDAAKQVGRVWSQLAFVPPFHFTSIGSAEVLKVALNAWLSTKITFANTLAELCQAVGDDADVDEITAGLLLSEKTTGAFGWRAGVGDGGPCRPRDLVALSFLARQAQLDPNPFTVAVRQREHHARRLAERAASLARDRGLEVWLLGWSYKPGTALADGSAARLLWHYLGLTGRWCRMLDPVFAPEQHPDGWPPPLKPAVYLLAVPHEAFLSLRFPPGSVVVDPHGHLGPQPGVELVRVGRR